MTCRSRALLFELGSLLEELYVVTTLHCLILYLGGFRDMNWMDCIYGVVTIQNHENTKANSSILDTCCWIWIR